MYLRLQELLWLSWEGILAISQLESVLNLIRSSWREVETREDALTLFSMAGAVISSKPQIGIPFFEVFIWVDTFLGR